MKAESQTAVQATPRALRLLLAAAIFYIPNQSHFPDFSGTGLNVTNLLFFSILLLVVRNKAQNPGPAPLKKEFIFFFLVLAWGFLIGQVYDATTTLADLQVLKNCLIYMLFYFLAYYAVQDTKTIKFLFFVILFTTFFDAYLGLRQAMDYGFNFNADRRVAAPFSWNTGDANRSSAFYTIYLTLMGVTALYDRSSRTVRWLALACLAFGIFVNFFTYSRQSYGILAALALILTFRRSALLAVVIVIALFNYNLWLPHAAITRIDMTLQTKAPPPGVAAVSLNKQIAASSDGRFIIWGGAAKLIERNPWGIGLNHFERDIGTYAPAYAHEDANNYYVLCATEDGVLAPIAMILLMLGLYRLGRSVEKLDDGQDSKVYGFGLWLAVVAIALVNIYGSRFVDGNLMTNFWIFAGMAARYRAIVLEARTRAPQTSTLSKRHPAPANRTPRPTSRPVTARWAQKDGHQKANP
ncbi:putative O-antigen polymerase [Thiomonas sp. X19]|uniref:O-antigen ligase family protein n=1 Tax=Thiomonas sp. X19 TaxID=1050370 RepID=UPI000B628C02|nr:hypothetical protein [Thiomonas sp. X19]SCC91533.1 putative O-antigen polymerase [Thiomonas sp. X19]